MITFRTLCAHLSERIGRHYLPLDTDAHAIGELLEEGSAHHDLVKTLLHDLYATAGCRGLDDSAPLLPLLDCLGETRHALKERGGDVDQLCLIDDLGEALVALYRDHGLLPETRAARPRAAQIVPLRRRPPMRLPRRAG